MFTQSTSQFKPIIRSAWLFWVIWFLFASRTSRVTRIPVSCSYSFASCSMELRSVPINVSSPRYRRTPIRREVFFSSCAPFSRAARHTVIPSSAAAASATVMTGNLFFFILASSYSIGYSNFS